MLPDVVSVQQRSGADVSSGDRQSIYQPLNHSSETEIHDTTVWYVCSVVIFR